MPPAPRGRLKALPGTRRSEAGSCWLNLSKGLRPAQAKMAQCGMIKITINQLVKKRFHPAEGNAHLLSIEMLQSMYILYKILDTILELSVTTY
jgi:hypothetical protein